jgi:hypothetical protein
MVKKSKILAFSALLAVLVLSMFNATFSVAVVSQQGDGVSVQLTKANPRAYGVIVPAPNMYVTTRLQGSYQANLDIIDWDAGLPTAGAPDFTINTETVPGNDISWLGPQYSDGGGGYFPTATNDGYIDPAWIRWFNLTALNAQNGTLANPFDYNLIWNQYSFTEGGSLLVPVNWSIPMQIDITINSLGPKLLKVNWFTHVDGNFLGTWNVISPSGDIIGPNVIRADIENGVASEEQYDVLQFVAHETGTYKLLIIPGANTQPTNLLLEFISPTISTLPLSTATYGGPGSADPIYMDRIDNTFYCEWWRLSAQKGDKFVLDVSYVYSEDSDDHWLNIWYPCSSGYIVHAAGGNSGYGVFDIIAPITGDIYISCISRDYWSNYRNRFYCEKVTPQTFTLNGTETIQISRYERKAFDFTLEEDTFLRVNTTVIGTAGTAFYGWSGQTASWTAGSFTYLDTLKTWCAQPISALDTKTENYTYGYYYLPKGDYEFLVRNSLASQNQDGVIVITTSFVDYDNASIPVQTLAYDTYYHRDMESPTAFAQLIFKADDYEQSLKKAKWVEVNITKPGQYYVNATIWKSYNTHTLQPYVYPSYVLVRNDTDGSIKDFTAEALDQSPNGYFELHSLDPDSTFDDACYVAYPQKWHDIELNFTQAGTATGRIDLDVWEAPGWSDIPFADTTNDCQNNGTLTLSMTSSNYGDWDRGAPFDVPGIDERLYYWLRIHCDQDWDGVPIVNHIRLSNTTLIGDLNWLWVRDSPYQFCDYWTMDATDIDDLGPVALMDGYENDSNAGYIDFWTYQGIESDVVKFLIIPEMWSYPGDIVVGVSVHCFNSYNLANAYNITANPIIGPWQIQDGVAAPLGSVLFNYTTYPAFSINHQFNSTRYTDPSTGLVRYIINCTGSYLNWTQLICAVQNVSSYSVYLVQDLPWVSNTGPNSHELLTIDSGQSNNMTYEFGVLNGNFYIIFDLNPSAELVTLKVCLTQYNTAKLYLEAPVVPVAPIIPGYPLLITLGVSITAVVVIAYTIRKRKVRK